MFDLGWPDAKVKVIMKAMAKHSVFADALVLFFWSMAQYILVACDCVYMVFDATSATLFHTRKTLPEQIFSMSDSV